jgi:hypothetical protein
MLIFTYGKDVFTCYLLVSANLEMGIENVAWMGPPLSSLPCIGAWNTGQSINKTFSITLTLLPLSTVLQGGERSSASWILSWCLSFPMPRWGWRTWGCPYRGHWDFYLNERPSLNPFYIKCPLHIQPWQSIVLTAWFMRPVPTPNYLGPPTSGWSYRPASYESPGKIRLSGRKNVS